MTLKGVIITTLGMLSVMVQGPAESDQLSIVMVQGSEEEQPIPARSPSIRFEISTSADILPPHPRSAQNWVGVGKCSSRVLIKHAGVSAAWRGECSY